MDKQAALNEYSDLLIKKAGLMKELAKVERMKEVWPEAFIGNNRLETFTTRLGGTGTVPITMRYWMRRLDDDVKKEITWEQWKYIYPEDA